MPISNANHPNHHEWLFQRWKRQQEAQERQRKGIQPAAEQAVGSGLSRDKSSLDKGTPRTSEQDAVDRGHSEVQEKMKAMSLQTPPEQGHGQQQHKYPPSGHPVEHPQEALQQAPSFGDQRPIAVKTKVSDQATVGKPEAGTAGSWQSHYGTPHGFSQSSSQVSLRTDYRSPDATPKGEGSSQAHSAHGFEKPMPAPQSGIDYPMHHVSDPWQVPCCGAS